MSELSERLRTATSGQSIDDVVFTLTTAGHRLGRNTVAKFLRGDHGPRPSEKVLTSFAATYGMDVGELRELAGRPRGELGPWNPPDESASLTKPERDAMDQLIRAIVKGEGSDSGQDEAQKIPGEPGGPGDGGRPGVVDEGIPGRRRRTRDVG